MRAALDEALNERIKVLFQTMCSAHATSPAPVHLERFLEGVREAYELYKKAVAALPSIV